MAVDFPFFVRVQHVISSTTDAMKPRLAVVTCRFFPRVLTRAILFLTLHVAGGGKPCLGSVSAVEQPLTARPRSKHGQAKIDQKIPLTTTSTRFSGLFVRDLDAEFCVTGP